VTTLQSPGGEASTALRDFGLGAQVLADIGCRKVRLMIWSDRRIPGLEGFGIEVVERVAIPGARPRVSRGAQ
jgi:3,4-dihydroxy 2-butanone 4-phosphate synthase/GTP cyclohydrolase II